MFKEAEMSVANSVALFRKLASLPSIKSGLILKNVSNGSTVAATNSISLAVTWIQRDLERSENLQCYRNYAVTNDVIQKLPFVELNNEQWRVPSPSGQLLAIIRKLKDKKGAEDKQFLEVWSKDRKIINIDVNSLEQHGTIYDNDYLFGALAWSSSEEKILYIAEKKQAKSRSYFQQGEKKATESEGDTFLYKQKWGEQMGEKSEPVLCIFDVPTCTSVVLDWLPAGMSFGQAVWGPDDSTVYLIGWEHEPYRLGIIYCPMRKNNLLRLNLKEKTYVSIKSEEEGKNNRSVHSPILSPRGDKLVYLDNAEGGPHMQCVRLVKHDILKNSLEPVIQEVKKSGIKEFPGLHCTNLHPMCWSKDNKRIVVASHWRSKIELLVINVEDKTAVRLTEDDKIGVWKFLDMDCHDNILACHSSINTPDHLVLAKLPEAGHEKDIKWQLIDVPEFEDGKKIKWSIENVQVPQSQINKKFDGIDYDYLLIEPSETLSNKPPLLVYNHGGPHSAMVAGFSHPVAGLCLSGMSLLFVNYRGSYGFGQDNIDSLLGNIGSQDVADVVYVVEELIKVGKADRSNLGVIGGSHGGFLTLHMIGQFPEMFKVAVSRNPVFNLTTLLGTSDIPDWVYTEVGLRFEMDIPLSTDVCSVLYEKSPIAHIAKAKTPTLFLLGGKDQRVPSSQGIQCMQILNSKKVPTKVYFYPESNHSLADVDAESDGFVNIVKWLDEHLETSNK